MNILDAIRGLIAWTPLGLPAFLFVITLVFFHELGHFLVARFFGVKVEVFSVGFGREIFGVTDRRGTRWKLSWIPVGGYVKFSGDSDAASTPDRAAAEKMSEAERATALAFKPVGPRAAVAAAGPFANFILAIVLLTGLFLYNGHAVIAPVIGEVTPNSPAAAAGIQPGDRVTRIDGTAITDFQQLPEIISISGGDRLAVGVNRAGQALTLYMTPQLMKTRDVLGNLSSQMVIGVRPDTHIPVTIERYGPLGAFGAACSETWNIIHTTLVGIGQMVTGHASADQLRGPLGIANMTREVANFGFVALLNLVAILSVSIGLANLFPIPLLDGGHLLYYAVEAVLGRPLGERAQDVGFRLGLVLVLGLMLLTTWNDLVRLNFSENRRPPGGPERRVGRKTRMRKLRLRSRLLRATSAGLALALVSVPAAGQLREGAADRAKALNAQQNQPQPPLSNAAAAAAVNPAGTVAASTAPQRVIEHIVVRGTQRVEPATVLTYIGLREGDPYTPADVDQALKALTATNLFSDVKTSYDEPNATLTIRVTENPIINQVVFEGNVKVSDKDLTKEVQIKPRAVFTRAKIQADVQRIIELYRRNGKFAARVEPEIIQRPQNRVDLIFSITDGPTTGVSRISFIGNKVFDSDTLKSQLGTEESRWYKFLASNDNYDPDRLQFDKESVRRYYINRGYADFKVLSAVAELTPDRKSFYITFTVDEGLKYKFGKITIDSKIRELPAGKLRPLIEAKEGAVYSQEGVQHAIDALTNAAGTEGYAFAQIHPRLKRNADTRTIDLSFEVVQGPRVYIEKITIAGNTKTLDSIIRRQFRLQEGDAFNRVLIDRSRTRIRGLGFFKTVDVKNVPGSQPDRTNLNVAVTEQSTGSLQVGLGYSSTTSLLGELSYTETDLFGRADNLKASIEASFITKLAQLSFTDPYFMDRELAAGFDIYTSETNFEQTSFQSNVTAAVLRLGFPISEYSTVIVRYTYKVEKVLPYAGAPLDVQLASGSGHGSIVGFSYGYNDLDDFRKPTSGWILNLGQEFAGFGGSLKYISTNANFATYAPLAGGAMVGSLSGRLGYITGYDGSLVPFNERFFDGGDTFRGFALAGVGSRDIAACSECGVLGNTVRAIGTASVRFPSLVPESYGIGLSLFTDFGTVGRLDNISSRICTGAQWSGTGTCVKDNLAFRGAAGISVQWKSPFGPVQIDMALPYAKTGYDRPQILHFSTATGY